MKKIKDFVKKNYKVAISFVLGMIVCIGIGVSAVATKDITYDNSKSGLTSTNLQGAIDELNTKATTKINEAKNECPSGYTCNKNIEYSNSNIVAAYKYDSSSCITGDEAACIRIPISSDVSVASGTIIKYKVNSVTTKYFHVLHDDGTTMTLQSQENIIYSTSWYEVSEPLDGDFWDDTKGPLTILPKLEAKTSKWSNVNDQTYTAGITFNTTCTSYNNCKWNDYTLDQRTAKARMITVQEAASVGCTESEKSCPNWMYNYLGEKTWGNTLYSTSEDGGYYTMNSHGYTDQDVWTVDYSGSLDENGITSVPSQNTYIYVGARAVVVINK